MLGRFGSTGLGGSALVSTVASSHHSLDHVQRRRLPRDQRLQSSTAGVLAQPQVALETVAAQWASQLSDGARRLWNGIVNYSPEYSSLGRFANVRRLFALGRLAGSSWNTYASSFRSFLKFLQAESIPVHEVTEKTLEMYVCYLAQTSERVLAGGTVASQLSGIRSCLRELGVTLVDPVGTAGALAGYKRFALAVLPRPLAHAAWPIEFTAHALRLARGLLHSFRTGVLNTSQRCTVIGAAHIVMATLTFSRGHTTNNVRLVDFEFTSAGFAVALRSQKRPQDRLPQQQHRVDSGRGGRTDPVQFLLDYVAALRFLGADADSLLFPGLKFGSFTLDASVKHFVALCDFRHSQNAPLTGHTVRVGAVSSAFAIGVPLVTCAYMCAHTQLSSTQGYVRHGIRTGPVDVQYFGHLRPSTGGQGSSVQSL